MGIKAWMMMVITQGKEDKLEEFIGNRLISWKDEIAMSISC